MSPSGALSGGMHPPVKPRTLVYFSTSVNVWFSPPSLIARSVSPNLIVVVPTRPPTR